MNANNTTQQDKQTAKDRVNRRAQHVVSKLIGERFVDDEDFRPGRRGGPPGGRFGSPGGSERFGRPPVDDSPGDPDAVDLDAEEERTEVNIANDIIAALEVGDDVEALKEQVRTLATELLTMHGECDDGNCGDDGPPLGDDDLGEPEPEEV